MANTGIFSLTDARLINKDSPIPIDGGIFLIYAAKGSCEVTGATEKTELTEHRCFIGDALRGYGVSADELSRIIFISVSGELVTSLFGLYGIKDGFGATAPEAAELFEELLLIPEKKLLTEDEKQDLAALTFHRLTYALHRSLGTRLVRRTALRIKEYIDAHAEEKNDLSELSKIFFMSKTHLHRLFKDEYGVSPIKYLIDRKIELSKQLLENGDLRISDVAEALSFSDARHFSKTFLKHEGMLPSEYRKRKQQ